MGFIITVVLSLAAGLACGVVFYLLKSKNWDAERQVAEARLTDLKEALEREKENIRNLENTFRGLSSEILKESRDEFLKQAEPKISEHIRPLKEALERYDHAIKSIENKREEAYGGLKGLLRTLQDGQARLASETSSLTTALKNPAARGKWGEITLQRVVEVAGMSQYCDFEQQTTIDGDNGKLRPDLIVRLPGGRTVVVDAKAPLNAYMSALESTDETSRGSNLTAHAQAVREHMRKLGQKSYWAQFDNAPDFVVLFLPGESFFSAALEQDRDLIEDGMKSKVVLSTPTTLIALLRVVAMGWQHEQLAENSQRISEAGKDLFDRFVTFSDHFSRVGSGLDRAIDSFNKAVGSWESRVIPGARKLKELGATKSADAEVPSVEPIERIPRKLAPTDSDEETIRS